MRGQRGIHAELRAECYLQEWHPRGHTGDCVYSGVAFDGQAFTILLRRAIAYDAEGKVEFCLDQPTPRAQAQIERLVGRFRAAKREL